MANSFDDRVTVPPSVLVRTLDKESVLLNLESERYFGLDEVGTRMWQLATTSPSIETAFQKLLAEFDVEPELLRTNLTNLLGHLTENGLLRVVSADAEPTSAV